MNLPTPGKNPAGAYGRGGLGQGPWNYKSLLNAGALAVFMAANISKYS